MPPSAPAPTGSVTYSGGRDAAGHPHGDGTMTFGDGAVYNGQWHHNTHIKGTRTFKSGETQHGSFRNGELHGDSCTMTWPNFDRYEGGMHEGRYHGIGTYWKAPGLRYDGEFHLSKQQGFGVQRNGDTIVHCGSWKDDAFTAECPVPVSKLPAKARPCDGATLLFPNGNVFVGSLNERHQPHGLGTLFNAHFQSFASGVWVDGAWPAQSQFDVFDPQSQRPREFKCIECSAHAVVNCGTCAAYFCKPHCDAAHQLRIHKSHVIREIPPRPTAAVHAKATPASVAHDGVPATMIPSEADKPRSLPCEALICVDWQSIHPPLAQLVPFFEGLTGLALGRPGVSAIRTINVVIDRTKMPAISTELDRLAARFKLSLIDVQAIKAQAADARLSHRLRTEPRPAVFGEREADLVMLVSGDSDFSPDLCRLVSLGHRVILVYNRQAKKPFKRNPMWESAVDFMDLDSMRPYNEQQKERRAQRDEARAQEQERSIVLRVSSMQLRGADLNQRLPGMSGMCMDSEGHALILTDSVNDRLYRFSLDAASAGTMSDPLAGSLQLLAGRGPSAQAVHYIICVNAEEELPSLLPLHSALKSQLSGASRAHGGSQDRVTVIRFGDEVSFVNIAPVAVDQMPAFGASDAFAANPRLLFEHLSELLEELDTSAGRWHVELIVCTRAAPFTATAHTILASVIASRSLASAADSSCSSSCTAVGPSIPRASLHCTFLCPNNPDAADLAAFRSGLSSLGPADCLVSPSSERWPDAKSIEAQIAARQALRSSVEHASLIGLAEFAQLSRPSEVVVDPVTGVLFVCDTGNSRIAVFDRRTNRVSTLTPTVAGVARCPRHLFLDSRARRLWITDLADGTLGFFDVAALELGGNGTVSANFTVVRTALHPGVSAPLPLLSRSSAPSSKCLSANGRDLMFCDEQLQAFCQLTQTGAEFSSAVVYRWASEARSSEAPPNTKNAAASSTRLQFDSLLLDSDGSYLFADCSSHCIKRLVQVSPSDAKPLCASSSSDSSAAAVEWKISLVAGKGQGGFADGEARESRFKFPATLVADISEPSSLFICERGNRRLRKLHALRAHFNGHPLSEIRGLRCAVRPSPLALHLPMIGSAPYKTRLCKPFQQGECKYQHAQIKCNFIHECNRCRGTHSERNCEHAARQPIAAGPTCVTPSGQWSPPTQEPQSARSRSSSEPSVSSLENFDGSSSVETTESDRFSESNHSQDNDSQHESSAAGSSDSDNDATYQRERSGSSSSVDEALLKSMLDAQEREAMELNVTWCRSMQSLDDDDADRTKQLSNASQDESASCADNASSNEVISDSQATIAVEAASDIAVETTAEVTDSLPPAPVRIVRSCAECEADAKMYCCTCDNDFCSEHCAQRHDGHSIYALVGDARFMDVIQLPAAEVHSEGAVIEQLPAAFSSSTRPSLASVVLSSSPVAAVNLPRSCEEKECEEPATVYCYECDKDLCDEHAAQLHRAKQNPEHFRVPLVGDACYVVAPAAEEPVQTATVDALPSSPETESESVSSAAVPEPIVPTVTQAQPPSPALPSESVSVSVVSPLSIPSAVVIPLDPAVLVCRLCDRAFNNQVQLQQHCDGRVHNSKLAQQSGAAAGKAGSPMMSMSHAPYSPSMPVNLSPALSVSQHASFRRDHPSMLLQRRSNPNKEPSYRCMVCPMEPLVGPIHRALAHTSTVEHKQHVNGTEASKVRSDPPFSSAAPVVSFSVLSAAASSVRLQQFTDAQAAIYLREYLQLISTQAREALCALSDADQL